MREIISHKVLSYKIFFYIFNTFNLQIDFNCYHIHTFIATGIDNIYLRQI